MRDDGSEIGSYEPPKVIRQVLDDGGNYVSPVSEGEDPRVKSSSGGLGE
jgi:hypothetical protein